MNAEDPAASGGESTPEPSTLGGRYELGALLGQGGMAVVRLGTDLRLGRTVAVKMLRGDLTESPAFQVRFRREARAAASLNHRAIVSVYDAGEETIGDAVALYIVMEYVDGQTLRELLRNGPFIPDRALGVTADILDALEESHQAGIVHRDVKPANAMVTPTGAVKVMDFGVARAVADLSAALTQTSTVIGTAHYLSPEQARGESVDPRSDVYSTGCLLYELLTGRPPFQGDSAIAVAYQHVREDPQPPSAYEPGVSPEIDSIVLRALAKAPGERYQSAEQMRSDILAVLDGGQPAIALAPAEPTTEPQPVVEGAEPTAALLASEGADTESGDQSGGSRRRRRIGLIVAAVAVFLGLAVAGFALSGLVDGPGGTPGTDKGPVRGGNSQSPPPQDRSEPEGPAGSSNRDSNGLSGNEQPQRVGDPGAEPRQGSTPQDSGNRQPQATQGSDPQRPTASSSPQEPTSQEPTPSDSPSESSEPPPSTTEEPTTPTTTAPDGGQGD